MDKNDHNNCYCQCCGKACKSYIVRNEDRIAYCSEECLLADRLRYRLQIISKITADIKD